MTVAFNHLGKLGQLGNQMFQYAATKGVASKLDVPFMIPNHRQVFDDGIGNRYTILLFDAFKLTSASLLGTLRTENYVQENGFTFNKNLFKIDKTENCSLYGFFQTEKYFKHIEKQIRKDFTFKDEIKDECDDLIKQFTNPIALHIRRGDFIWNNKNHPPLSLDYYKSALELFDSDREVIIFSDLCLMSMCDDFIIANSTFSWWGAWLANRGKVVAPKNWFGETLGHDTKDLYCKGWTVL